MSDLYLVLRTRLRSVAARQQWLEIDGKTLRTAREQRGLSREALGRLVRYSSKTIERYEDEGRIPRADVPVFARALGLHIESADGAPLTATLDPEIVGQLDRLESGLAVLLEHFGLTAAAAEEERRETPASGRRAL